MSKLFLRMDGLAFSSFLSVSETPAALLVLTYERCWIVLGDLRPRSHALHRRYNRTRSPTAAIKGVRRWPDVASLDHRWPPGQWCPKAGALWVVQCVLVADRVR